MLGGGGTVSALDLSVGGGAYFAGNFGGGIDADMKMTPPAPYQSQAVSVKSTTDMPVFGGGIYGFFDAAFAEVSLGLFLGSGSWETKAEAQGQSQSQKLGDVSTTELSLGLLLKYPVAVSESMKLFPAVGIDYQSCLSAKMDDRAADEPGDLSRLWIKFGAGADFSLNEKLFIRPVVLYGIGLENQMEKDMGNLLKTQFAMYEAMGASVDTKVEAKLSHGLTVKVALGYNL